MSSMDVILMVEKVCHPPLLYLSLSHTRALFFQYNQRCLNIAEENKFIVTESNKPIGTNSKFSTP